MFRNTSLAPSLNPAFLQHREEHVEAAYVVSCGPNAARYHRRPSFYESLHLEQERTVAVEHRRYRRAAQTRFMDGNQHLGGVGDLAQAASRHLVHREVRKWSRNGS